MATDNHTGLVRPANRRTVMKALAAGAAAAVAAPVAAQAAQAAPGADTELIALCGRFTELEQRQRVIFSTGPDTIENEKWRDSQIKPIHAEQEEILDRVTEMEATTLDGIRARLRMVMASDPPCLTGSGWDDYMLEALLNDMHRVLA